MKAFEKLRKGIERSGLSSFPRSFWLVACLLMLVVLISYLTRLWLGFAMTILIAIVFYIVFNHWVKYIDNINEYILDLSYRIKRGEQEAIIKMPLGIMMYDDDFEIEWVNPYLQSKLIKETSLLGSPLEKIHKPLFELVKQIIQAENNPADERDTENNQSFDDSIIEWNGQYYQTLIQTDVRSIYLLDVSGYKAIKEDFINSQSVFGWLFLDNYDEIIRDLDDRGVSNFDSLITTYLSNWTKQHGIYYKRMNDDRYLLLFEYKELERLEEEKFNIIKNIREHTTKRNMPLTVSIGLSYGGASFNELDQNAQKNLDLALSRGGDQAVVRQIGEKPRFYGGSTNPMEKRTRVRSRIVSQTLQEQILQSPKTFVMGHQYPDMDAIGSSLGVARIGMMLGKDVYVVVDKNKIGDDISRLLDEIEKSEETAKHIISPDKAMKIISDEDLIVLVDHHQPKMSVEPRLYDKTDRYIIIDHHRRGIEYEKEPILVYIEPYASSAAELVTEFFEYVSADEKGLNRIEATALLGGIIVDTNGFSLRTGSRTFNAASYLQSVGANIALIQRLLKESPAKYLERGEMVKTMAFVDEGIVIAHGQEKKPCSQVMAAQTADTILGMADVEAAFVIVRLNDGRIGISARSLGSINVQRIMEKMGGGGHLSNAATQIEHSTIEQAKADLIEVIKESKK